MASTEHVDVLERGRYIWNQWRVDHPTERPDLRSAYLREAELNGYNLAGADLRAAMLLGAHLREANLEDADLSYADVRFVDFRGAKLTGARFHDAKGVEEQVLRATEGPSGWRKRLAALAGAVALLAGAYGVYRAGFVDAMEYRAWASEVGETAGAWFGGAEEPPADPAADPAGQAASGIDPALAKRLASIERRLLEVEFSTWRIEKVHLANGGLLVRTDQPSLNEEAYLPTVAAACGVLAGGDGRWSPAQIHVTDQSETDGWTFQSPENCRDLILTPPNVMRLAIAADTRAFGTEGAAEQQPEIRP